MAVKLKGEIAKTKPSSARYSTRLYDAVSPLRRQNTGVHTYFHAPGAFFAGCCEYSSSTYFTPKRKKSDNYPQIRLNCVDDDCQDVRIPHLGCSIDLCLPCILALAEHRGCHELVTVLPAHKVRSLEEDGRAIVPRQRLPLLLCGKGTFDGAGYCRLICFVVRTDVLRMVCGQGLLGELACLDLRRIMSSSEMDFHNS